MEELYRIIEMKIKASGYPGFISGEQFYADVTDEIESREAGSYLYLIKKSDTLSYSGTVDVLADQIDLHTLDIHEGDQSWHVDFDA